MSRGARRCHRSRRPVPFVSLAPCASLGSRPSRVAFASHAWASAPPSVSGHGHRLGARPRTSRTDGGPGPSTQGDASAPFLIEPLTMMDKRKYAAIFYQTDASGDGYVEGDDARQLMVKSAGNLRLNAKSSMGCGNVFYVSAVQPPVQVIGGIATNIWARRFCCKPTVGLPIAVMTTKPSG